MKRIVVAFDDESISHAKKYGFNQAWLKSKQEAHWDIQEFFFDTDAELNAFIKGMKSVHTLFEPEYQIIARPRKRKPATV